VLLSKSGLSQLFTRLERRGLVERRGDPENLRVTYAILTEAGRETLERAQPAFREEIEERFAGHLTKKRYGRYGRRCARWSGPLATSRCRRVRTTDGVRFAARERAAVSRQTQPSRRPLAGYCRMADSKALPTVSGTGGPLVS
jgi:hypothetical protein